MKGRRGFLLPLSGQTNSPKKIFIPSKIALDRRRAIGYNNRELRKIPMQESPSGMASASQADSGGFDSRFLLQRPGTEIGTGIFLVKAPCQRQGAAENPAIVAGFNLGYCRCALQ